MSAIEDSKETLIDGFAGAISAQMRQDPYILVVGEMRDAETVPIIVQAALIRYLVLSNLHTQNAPSAISRLLDLEEPIYLIRATFVGVVTQRLVRLLCPDCPNGLKCISRGCSFDRSTRSPAAAECARGLL